MTEEQLKEEVSALRITSSVALEYAKDVEAELLRSYGDDTESIKLMLGDYLNNAVEEYIYSLEDGDDARDSFYIVEAKDGNRVERFEDLVYADTESAIYDALRGLRGEWF